MEEKNKPCGLSAGASPWMESGRKTEGKISTGLKRLDYEGGRAR